MRKIHNIHDLRQAQKAVEQRRHQLEKELQHDWNDMKEYLTTGSNSFLGFFGKQYGGSLMAQGISFGAGILSRKIGSKIGDKLFGWLK